MLPAINLAMFSTVVGVTRAGATFAVSMAAAIHLDLAVLAAVACAFAPTAAVFRTGGSASEAVLPAVDLAALAAVPLTVALT